MNAGGRAERGGQGRLLSIAVEGSRLQSREAERGRFHGVENRLPLCGKVAETCFHCVENFAKHVSIVWKTPRNTFPLCGKPGKQEREE